MKRGEGRETYMNSSQSVLSNSILPIYEKALRWAVVGIAAYYLLWTLLQYVIWDFINYRIAKWACLILVIAVILYIPLCALSDPERLRINMSKLRKHCTFEQIFLISLVFWDIVSCSVWKNAGKSNVFKHNDNRMFIIWMSAFILFPLAKMLGAKGLRRFWETMTHIMTAVYTPISILALVKYYQGVEMLLPSGNSITTYGDSSIMIGSNRNITAAAAAVMVALCIYMIIVKRGLLRGLYVGAILVHALVLIVSNSRTSFLTTLFLADVTVTILCWSLIDQYCREKKMELPLALRIVITAVIVMLFTVLLIKLRGQIISITAKTTNSKLKTRKEYTNLTGRKAIWAASLKVMLSNPVNFIFGVTPAYVKSNLYATGMLTEIKPHAHNVLMQVGVSLGVPAMVLYIVFLMRLCYRCVLILWRKIQPGEKRRGSRMWYLSTILLFLMMYGIVEVMYFSVNIVILPIFYILAGWILLFDRQSGRLQKSRYSLGRGKSTAKARRRN